ncbi:MAG: tetratricopeptide repeat protein [Bryobacteraceae bacterium]
MNRLLSSCLLVSGLQWAAAPVFAQVDPEIGDFDRMIASGRYTEAEAPLEAYVASHPDSWQALYQIGYVDFRSHKILLSVEALSRSLVLRVDQPEAHKILGFDLTILGKLDLAEVEMRQAIRLDPNSAESRYELGKICYERGQQGCAVQELQTAIWIAPAYVKAHHNLGLAYEASNDFARARRSFERAIELNREQSRPSSWPYTDYAGFLNRRYDFAGALALCRLAVEADPRADQAWFEMAKAYRGLADIARSVTALERAIELQRKPDYLYVLSQAYRKQGREAEARKVLSEFEIAKAKLEEH